MRYCTTVGQDHPVETPMVHRVTTKRHCGRRLAGEAGDLWYDKPLTASLCRSPYPFQDFLLPFVGIGLHESKQYAIWSKHALAAHARKTQRPPATNQPQDSLKHDTTAVRRPYGRMLSSHTMFRIGNGDMYSRHLLQQPVCRKRHVLALSHKTTLRGTTLPRPLIPAVPFQPFGPPAHRH